MSWLSRFLFANWSILMGCLLLAMAMIIGVQIGEARIQSAWNAEKIRAEQVVAKQEQHVEDIRLGQAQINQEISNDYAKNSKVLAGRQSDSRTIGMCDYATTSGNSVPAVPDASQGAAVPATYAIFASDADARGVSCEQLEKDAAQTTLMLLEVQRWYQKQSALHP
jgi:hypothetical protein